MKMKKYGLFILLSTLVIPLCTSMSCTKEFQLGEEFSLSIGQTVVIADEDLQVTFTGVSGDSRCPIGVVCVWAGEVKCLMMIEEGVYIYYLDFVHSGATDDYSHLNHGNYQYTFKVEPYPVYGQEIRDSEYRIFLTVSK
ncbi:MAG: hypothetical protein PHE15_05560 [Dehalococcoidales bacterium]|nr:hypothetical protein [Dehalococcoidales bacterium]